MLTCIAPGQALRAALPYPGRDDDGNRGEEYEPAPHHRLAKRIIRSLVTSDLPDGKAGKGDSTALNAAAWSPFQLKSQICLE